MTRARNGRAPKVAEQVLGLDETSLLDLLDHVLNKGVMATGDVTMGVAGIDLIYLRLSALLCAADRALPPDPKRAVKKTRARRPRGVVVSSPRRSKVRR